jgi:hypothetical protein
MSTLKQSIIGSRILFNFFEKIARSHPLIYFVTRSLVRFTTIHEEDSNVINL